jgi:3-deoxy-manno-octulosonate cytidylyltransferase (CMP-KDO synthetase)
MVQWVFRAATESGAFSEVVIATDDSRIASVVKDFGGRVVMTDVDHPSGTDRVIEVAQQMPQFDAYVNLQGDEPLVPTELLRSFVSQLERGRQDQILTAATDIAAEEMNDFNVVKLVFDTAGRACYFSRSAIPHSRSGEFSPELCFKHIGLYGFTQSALRSIAELQPHPIEKLESLEQLRWLLNGLPIYVHLCEYEAHGIDTLEQALAVEKLLDK